MIPETVAEPSWRKMDLVCTRCGEPWDLSEVMHERPHAFRRRGGLIRWCPTCPAVRPALSDAERQRLGRIAEAAMLFGEDVDGLAATLADSDLL